MELQHFEMLVVCDHVERTPWVYDLTMIAPPQALGLLQILSTHQIWRYMSLGRVTSSFKSHAVAATSIT